MPSQLFDERVAAGYDLTAQLSGMSLTERWSDWTRKQFTNDSTAHISVWETPKS